jgi:HPt (histidine-containing phosphotransfer) domain-containing protein
MKTEAKVEKEVEKHIPLFLSLRQKEIILLKTLLAANDFEAIARTCHNLKGIAKPYGFPTLGDIAKNIEEECGNKNIKNIELLINQISYYIQQYL